MNAGNNNLKQDQLEKAIAAQENLRGILDDEIIDAAIAALKKQLSELAPEPALEQQRKQVTILFADVVSSTQLMQELDPEENMMIMDAALQQLAEQVKAYGGRVTRFMGDGFLAVFGLPRARENDPEMAIRAGLGIIDESQTIASSLKENYRLDNFSVRVGVNTGLVVAGGVTEAEGTMMGSAVNLAARLESAAPPGGVLISQHTYSHVRGIFELQPRDPIPMKGFLEPIKTFLVDGMKPHAHRSRSRGVEGVETPLVGRESEMSKLQETTRFVVQENLGQFITIVGDAGVGKTRLLEEFEKWLIAPPGNFYILKGRAELDTAKLPYSLLRNLFISQFGILDDDPASVVREKVTNSFKTVLGEDQEYQMQAHFVGQLMGYDFHESPYLHGVLDTPQQIRDRAIVYLVNYLTSCVSDIPLVLFLDDIHWADDSSLDILTRIFDSTAEQAVLIVALSRPSIYARRPSWGDGDLYHRLDLEPLSTKDSEFLLELVLDKLVEIPSKLRSLIIGNAEGNPFYLEELVRMLFEEGVIDAGDPQWEVKLDRLPELTVPATLTGVIQARLDRLTASQRGVVQRASVVGKVFWDEALVYIGRHLAEENDASMAELSSLEINLTSLQDRELVFQRIGSAFLDAAEYMFKHAILQEVTYESVLKSTRRSYHGLVADWLITRSGDRVGEFTGLIAGHLEKSGRSGEALEYLCRAAAQAESNYAIDEAAEFIDRALVLAPEDDLERRYSLLKSLSEILRMQGNRARYQEILESLTSLADRLDDETKKAEVLIKKAWYGFWTSDFPGGRKNADKAVAISANLDNKALAVEANYVSGWLLSLLGEVEPSLEKAEIALSLVSEIGDRRLRGNILNLLGTIYNSIGHFYQAMGYLGEFLAISREIGDQEREITALNNLGTSLTRLGDFDGARENFLQMLKIVQDTGDRSAASTAHINLAWVETSAGNWERAREAAELGIESKRKHGQLEALAEGLLWLGHAWQGLSQPDKAISFYQESMEYRIQMGQEALVMGLHAALARLAVSQKDLAQAHHHADQILAFLDRGGSLTSVWEPGRIYYSCYQVLKLNHHPRAGEILEIAFKLIQEQADQILDPKYQNLFLNNIPWHQEIIEAWQAVG
jgi:class 3 adenylate cyclase/tetratricopeptide (TPR) repeat protein